MAKRRNSIETIVRDAVAVVVVVKLAELGWSTEKIGLEMSWMERKFNIPAKFYSYSRQQHNLFTDQPIISYFLCVKLRYPAVLMHANLIKHS